MIANEDRAARTGEKTPEEESLLERSTAPTLRDLRAAAKELFAMIAMKPDSALSKQLLPEKQWKSKP